MVVFPVKVRLFPLIALLVISYFGYHTIHGGRGWYRMKQLKAEIKAAEIHLAQTQEQKRIWQTKVNALSGKQLDLDQLEESAFRVLNMVYENDSVIFETEEAEERESDT